MRIDAVRELRFESWGVRLQPGENHLPDNIPHGLRRSFERHEKAGNLKVQWVNPTPLPPTEIPKLNVTVADDDDEEEGESLTETPETLTETPQVRRYRKRRRR